MKKVYFTKEISKDSILKIYKVLEKELKGKVAVKVHSGEVGNQNFLGPELFKDVIDYVSGVVVECNTAYDGKRRNTSDHLETMKLHGWSKYFKVDILDEKEDIILKINDGKHIGKNYVGANLVNYDSMLVLSHFKGHPMGGFGGALKNISIGLESSYGKAYIHGAGDPAKIWTAERNSFIESMADAAKSIVDYFKDNIVFINVMANMSVDCDCCSSAEDPCIKDIGVLASLDPVSLDKACLDLIYNCNDSGKEHLIKRIESRNGSHIIEAAKDINVGDTEYELINIDEL